MKSGCKKQVFILRYFSVSIHWSCWKQTCWVNIDTRQCRNPTRDPKSMLSDSVFPYTWPYTHFKTSGTGAPSVCSLEAEKPKFYCRPPDFWSQLTNYSFWCLILCQLISPDSDKDKKKKKTPFRQLQIKWLFRKSDVASALSEGEQVLLLRPTIVQLPLRPDSPLILLLVCVPTSISGNTRWAWSCGWNTIQWGHVWPERTAASGSCHRFHLLYVHMYE